MGNKMSNLTCKSAVCCFCTLTFCSEVTDRLCSRAVMRARLCSNAVTRLVCRHRDRCRLVSVWHTLLIITHTHTHTHTRVYLHLDWERVTGKDGNREQLWKWMDEWRVNRGRPAGWKGQNHEVAMWRHTHTHYRRVCVWKRVDGINLIKNTISIMLLTVTPAAHASASQTQLHAHFLRKNAAVTIRCCG